MSAAIANPSTSTSHDDGVEEGARHVVAEAELVDAGDQPEERHAPVEEDADRFQLAGRDVRRVRRGEADLFQVDGSERALDRQEPRAVAGAGA